MYLHIRYTHGFLYAWLCLFYKYACVFTHLVVRQMIDPKKYIDTIFAQHIKKTTESCSLCLFVFLFFFRYTYVFLDFLQFCLCFWVPSKRFYARMYECKYLALANKFLFIHFLEGVKIRILCCECKYYLFIHTVLWIHSYVILLCRKRDNNRKSVKNIFMRTLVWALNKIIYLKA